jgi:hypothetical protein
MTPSTAVAVWNRALDAYRGCENLGRGDRALAALLLAHGQVMNGGVFHTIETMQRDDLADFFRKDALDKAVAGYEFFGLGAVGGLLARAKDLLLKGADIGALEASIDSEYERIIPDDSFLFSAFERYFVDNPSDFAACPS